MAISTKVTIHIAGETMTRFSRLVINQKVNTHHTFSVLQPIPKEFVGYIGQALKIEIEPNNMSTESGLVFHGIITEAQMVRASGAAGGIIINGYSPTIVMEGSPKSKSFTNQSLSDIVKEISGRYSQKSVQPTVSIQRDSSLPYTVQYAESDFAFLSRMAEKKGQWFYFNGEASFFGTPKSKTFTLEYGRSLHSFNIEMRAKPLGFEFIGYDPSSAETQTANSKEINHQPKGISKSAFDASNKLYPEMSTTLYGQAVDEGSSRIHLVDRITTQMQSSSSDLVTAKGESDETGLRVGDVVVINESGFSMTGNPIDGLKEQNFGSYILTDVLHVCDESGSYHNSFCAVPESVLAPPYGNVRNHPVAETQPATVIDNNDPAGLGRVQVQMAWQKDGSNQTPWIRMTNPHAGGGKGMYFIPEIGEEVLVSHEGGNAEKPYVLGAMYNGNESSSYSTAGNDQKVIQTRSGTKIIMNDAIGSVFIEDPSGNTWLMDGKGNISVNAPNTINMNATDINITASKDINVTAGVNQSVNVGMNQSTSVGMVNRTFVGGHSMLDIVGNHIENIEGNKESHTKEERVVKSVKGIESSSIETINKHSEKEIKNRSGAQSKTH
jgi:type VI secretion system secreted protein VgrG